MHNPTISARKARFMFLKPIGHAINMSLFTETSKQFRLSFHVSVVGHEIKGPHFHAQLMGCFLLPINSSLHYKIRNIFKLWANLVAMGKIVVIQVYPQATPRGSPPLEHGRSLSLIIDGLVILKNHVVV